MHILLVEDDKDIRESLLYALTELGHGVEAVCDVREAIGKYSPDKFDVVLSDHGLPKWGTGLDLIEILRAKNPGLQFILITANATVDLAVQAMRKGAADFVVKPIDLSELEQALERVTATQKKDTINLNMEDVEREKIQAAVNESETYAEAAIKLGMDNVTLWRKRKKYGIGKCIFKEAISEIDKVIKKAG